MRLVYYTDAGHGWIKVKRSVLEQLGLLNSISVYSYQDKTGQLVYLEEDCDASSLIETLRSRNIEHTIEEVDHGDTSYIRNLERFSK